MSWRQQRFSFGGSSLQEEAVVLDFGGNFVGEGLIGGFEGVEEGGVGGIGAIGIHDASGVSALE